MSPVTTIAHYRIVSKLGEGGMGAVYRATDTKLNREVAIKVLPPAFAEDTGRMHRFEREAQVLAALNHPNIAAIYGVEQGAIVMELVEGEDLRGPVPVATALSYARQIAAALEAAHEKGIVHRDLKPANVKVTPDGVVKLLDFGLAKVAEDGSASIAGTSPTRSTTLSMAMTQAGMILGTAAYMSPEQARGKPVDRRADIWAFGVVLFELLAGGTLFGGGETAGDAMAAVVTQEPDWSALPPDTPAHIHRLLERCLRKDPKTRLRDIGEARIAIDEPPPSEAPLPTQTISAFRLPWAVAIAAVLVSLALAAHIAFRPQPEEPRAMRFAIPLPEGTLSATQPNAPQAAASPDGRYVAFVARDAKTSKDYLWLRALSSLAAQKLERTEGANFPFWSPDSRYIGYFGDGTLNKVAVSGRLVQTIAEAGSTVAGVSREAGATWNREGVVVFSHGGVLLRVPAAGGPATTVTTLDAAREEVAHTWPQFLPDGRHILYHARSQKPENSGIYIQELGSPRRTLVLISALRAAFANPGFLLFANGGALRAQALDLNSFRLRGETTTLEPDISVNNGNARAAFNVSESGILVYRSGNLFTTRQLTWYDREGHRLGTVGSPGPFANARFSPDEKRVAVNLADSRGAIVNTWVMDLANGVLTRMTFDSLSETTDAGAWSPDSQRLAIASTRGGMWELTVASQATRRLLDSSDELPADWLPDGQSLVVKNSDYTRISIMPLSGERKPEVVLDTPYAKPRLRLSPDGRWIAYDSAESGTLEVFVASFPSFTEKKQVSSGGGDLPVWRKDGKELFFVGAGSMLMVAGIRTAPKLESDVPQALFKVNESGPGSQYSVSADGQRFLVNQRLDSADEPPINVVLNWMADLKQK